MEEYSYELNRVYTKKELEWLVIAYNAITEYSSGIKPDIISLLLTETGERQVNSLKLVKNKLVIMKNSIVEAYKKYWKCRIRLNKLDDAISKYKYYC